MATNPQEFAAWMTPYAEQASAATGLDVGLIIAQWGNETAWGTEFAQQNNIGNVGVYGGGPNPSYPTLAAGVQAYINEMNSPAMAKAKAQWQGQSASQQAVVLGNSGYAGGGYNNGSGPGSDLIADMQAAGESGAGAVAGATSMSQADWQALAAAQAAGGTNYLEAANAQSSATAANNTATAADSTAASTNNASLTSDNLGGVSYTGTQQQTSALSTISGELQTFGFSPSQISELTGWAWGEITNNVDPTQIAIDLQSQPAFLQAFPGFAAANQELQGQGLPAVSVQQYQQYQTQAQAMAQAAGLPAGFINSQNVGTLIGGNVSTAELSSRINNATALAINSTPEQQQMFNEYFGTTYGDSGQGGLTTGQIAAIALDPSVAEPLIAQQITAGQIGGASVTSGVGALQKSTAVQLAQAGITESQATSAFQNLAPYSALETPRPGMANVSQGVVSPDQLVTGQLLGNPAGQRQLQTAQEVAKAPFTGGGGFVSNTKGAIGTGSASEMGGGNT